MSCDKKRTKKPIDTRVLVMSALLAALSIIFGKFLQIPIGEAMRISLENTPIILAALAFGPVTAALVGVVADLIGSLIMGYSINPIITLGAALIGALSGGCYRALNKSALPLWLKIGASVAVAHLLGSVVVKTLGLAAFYSLPLPELMLYRLLNYLLVGTLDGVIVYLILSNKYIGAKLKSMAQRSCGGKHDEL